jgi:hypothetical protein
MTVSGRWVAGLAVSLRTATSTLRARVVPSSGRTARSSRGAARASLGSKVTPAPAATRPYVAL